MREYPNQETGPEKLSGMPVRQSVTVAIDTLGGDRGMEIAVKGALAALERDPGLHLRLAGPRAGLQAQIDHLDPDLAGRVALVDAGQGIPGDMPPARALRHGGESSMARAIEQVRQGDADAVVSSGNTGALMAFSRHLLGMLTGIDRPALMSRLPSRNREGEVWVLDLGANVGVDARRLYEFALLGSAAVTAMRGGRMPRVGLLNVGSEASKGSDVVQEAARLIRESELNFAGFVEGHDVFGGEVDVVVCDGFVGNVLLKGAEGLAELLLDRLQQSLQGDLRTRMGARLIRRSMASLLSSLDSSRHNGAPLLGVGGIVIKSHGAAGTQAFCNAIELAARETRRGVITEVERQLWASY